MAEFSRGVVATINADWNSYLAHVSVQVYGEDAVLICEWFPEAKVEIYPRQEGTVTVVGEESGQREMGRRRLDLPSSSRWGGAYHHFIDCLVEGLPSISSIRDVRNTMDTVFQCYETGLWL